MNKILTSIFLIYLIHSHTAISNPELKPIFYETFGDKRLINNNIYDRNKRKIWLSDRVDKPGEVVDLLNHITKNGSLMFGGYKKSQTLKLSPDAVNFPFNFALTFQIKLHSMGNAWVTANPFEVRPLLSVVPRRDKYSYYEVRYYLENVKEDGHIFNLFRCKWDIVKVVNNETEIMAGGYFRLYENIWNDIELIISNDSEGFVNISLYIESPLDPIEKRKPFLYVKDTQPNRILNGIPELSFTMDEHQTVFNNTPIIELDNIKIYDNVQYQKIERIKNKNNAIDLTSFKNEKNFSYYRYLANKGIITEEMVNTYRKDTPVQMKHFIDLLLRANNIENFWIDINEKEIQDIAIKIGTISRGNFNSLNKEITNYEASYIIYKFKGNPNIDRDYKKLIRDKIPEPYVNPVNYVFQNNIINFNPDDIHPEKISFGEAVDIIIRILDPTYQPFNYELKVPHIIGDNVIFQRDKPIPIWGLGFNGEKIKVVFKKQVKETKVENGKWYLELEPEEAGGPYTLTIQGIKNKIVKKNIYIGEVFLIAGQSNAEFLLKNSFDYEETINNLLDQIEKKRLILRLYKQQLILGLTPNFTTKGYWYSANRYHLLYSSAVGTFFVEKLLQINPYLKGVPVGIVNLTFGGSTIELFMPDFPVWMPYTQRQHNNPVVSGYWNGYMKAIAPTKFRAVIFYQGENSVHLRYLYERLLRHFIEAIRREFKDKSLPFILVQLTGYGESYLDGDTWPIIREIQYRTAKTMNNVYIITATDLSEEDIWEIHPRIKKPIGIRLAYKVMEAIYGKDMGFRSPEMKNFQISGDKVKVYFDYVKGKLNFKEKNTGCFEVLDENGKWYKATGINLGRDFVEIWNDNIKHPLGARYAYFNYPKMILYDDNQMPVFPFNTTINLDRESVGVTDNFHIFLPYHGLSDFDAVLNLTRNKIFRTVKVRDINNLELFYSIPGQSSGDEIMVFSRKGSRKLEQGSTEKILKIKNHHLKVGDRVRNVNRQYIDSGVIEVIDDNTVLIEGINGQEEGDEIEIYILRYKDKAG
ncbi:MAG: sialate O-acetylesterase [bacterium]|nr:sialate O-acetylesterase [bacterium]